MGATKTCIKCGKEKIINEFVSNICKLCVSEYQKEYRENNKAKIAEQKHKYYQEHKEELVKLHEEWLIANPEKSKVYYAKYYKNHKEKINEKRRNDYLLNKEKRNQKNKIYRDNNKEKEAKRKRKYYQENKEKFQKQRNTPEHKERQKEYNKNYNIVNNEQIKKNKNKYINERMLTDPSFKLRRDISTIIYQYLKKYGSSKNGNSMLQYLSFTIEELKQHLEKLFEPWMTWDNWGIYDPNDYLDPNDNSKWKWQIDHITPHSDLPYSSMEDENFKKCWALENLRPLRADINHDEGVRRTRHRKNE